MPQGLSNDFKELVRSRTDLVELVGENVTLQFRGRDHVGLCPFHEDHNPSLTISSERQSYRCWVCDAGGDCFSWVMNYDKLEFRAALELLARRAGLEMPAGQSRGPKGSENVKQNLLAALSWAENEFHQFLQTARESQRARDYLEKRGFTAETVAKFKIGYHPNDWDWTLRRVGNRFSPQVLEAARLTAERKDGSGYRDDLVFIDRVTFPIHDERGCAVAFGGRILPDSSLKDPAKYLNGSESPVFVKSRLLYGLDVARDTVKKSGVAIVVEGYTDCMMIHQHGIGNAVATLGTALVESHVHLLRRFARKVVLVFDGDDAGQKAAERSVAKFLSQEVDLRILTLPAKQDPADFLNERGADAFRQLVADAAEAEDYKFSILEERYGLTTVDGRHQVLNEMVALFATAPRLASTVREDMMLGKLARKLGLPERAVRQQIKEIRKKTAARRPLPRFQEERQKDNRKENPKDNRKENPIQGNGGFQDDDKSFSLSAETETPLVALSPGEERLERELLEIIFAAPETIGRISGEIAAADFRHPELRTLLETCFEIAGKGVAPAYERVTSVLEEPALKRLAADIDNVSVKKEQLRLDAPNVGTVAPASLLDQVLDRLKWRRRTGGQGASSELLQSVPSDSSSLNSETKALLRRMTELRQADPTMKHRLESGRNH